MMNKKNDTKKIDSKNNNNNQEELLKITNILFREVNRIIFEIEDRQEILFKLWTKDRLRAPLIRVFRNRFDDMKVHQLIKFPQDVYKKIDEFYNFMDKFVFYISYTEDMPQTLKENFFMYKKELKDLATLLIDDLISINPCLKDDIFEKAKSKIL